MNAAPASLRGPADPSPETSLLPTRVALLTDMELTPGPWLRRGMTPERLQPVPLEILLVNPPDVVVVDTNFADARRVADCWQLKDLLRVPLIFLAERAAGDAVAAMLKAGADDVITTPESAEVVAAHVGAILRRLRERDAEWLAARLHFGSAQVDLVRRLVVRSGGSQSLSATEARLLEGLVRAGGFGCTNHELVARVWGAETPCSTHYLRLYIRYLRQKIEPEPMHPRYIRNVRGGGYRLVLEPVSETLDTAAADEVKLPYSQAAGAR